MIASSDPAQIKPQSTDNGLLVSRLRTVFFWPLTMTICPEAVRANIASRSQPDIDQQYLQEQFSALTRDGSPWTPVKDSLQHLPRPTVNEFASDDVAATERRKQSDYDAAAYGEYIYFHDFVQRGLFGSTSDPAGDHPLMLLERRDITGLSVRFEKGKIPFNLDFTVEFTVERLNFYLLQPGVAVLALQVAGSEPPGSAITLEQAMMFNNGMRRSHVPFFDERDLSPGGGLPVSVCWRNGEASPPMFDHNGRVEASGSGKNAKPELVYDRLMKTPPGDRKVFPMAHWQWLLNGDAVENPPMPFEPGAGRNFHWRHFADERLPILSTLILDGRRDYYALNQGQWMRLAFVDAPGTDPFPYAAGFMEKTFNQHCYDRYHHAEEAEADAPSRYLMCDYAMTAVTYRNEDPNKLNSYADTLSIHMQRHYYQLFLLAVIDKAVILMLSSRISAAVEAFDKARCNAAEKAGAESALSSTLQEIERDFLHYVHRFRFTGVSGQLQAGEMYDQIRAVMKLDAMFDDLRDELEMAVGFLSSREAQHATEAAERLNVIATLGIVIALVMGFFSMNILTSDTLLMGGKTTLAGIARHTFWFGGGLAVAGFGAWGLSHWISGVTGDSGHSPRPSLRATRKALVRIGLVGGVVLCLSRLAILR